MSPGDWSRLKEKLQFPMGSRIHDELSPGLDRGEGDTAVDGTMRAMMSPILPACEHVFCLGFRIESL